MSDGYGSLPDWLSAIAALAAIFISIVSFFQNKRIKELVDITNALMLQTTELSKQTEQLKIDSEIMKKRYELEADIALYNRIPNFQFRGVVMETVVKGNHAINFFLINRGAPAHGLHSRTSKEIDPITIKGDNIVYNQRPIDISFAFSDQKEAISFSGCKFDFYYSDDFGRLICQTIAYLRETRPEISKPLLIKE